MEKTTQEKLVLITLGIAIFLLGQYIWERIPRYEWQESIEKRVIEWWYGCLNTDSFCSPDGLTTRVILHGFCNNEETENKYVFCDEKQVEEEFEDGSKLGFCYCYIKEKVRIK